LAICRLQTKSIYHHHLSLISCSPGEKFQENPIRNVVNAFVRSKAHAIEQDVQKLRIVQDPKIHYDLLRFCQHTRLAFLSLFL
jgi:hypothetical protein